MSDVEVVSRKYDGAPHRRFPGIRLGEDEHGIWVGRTVGMEVTFGADNKRAAAQPQVHLLPRRGWWRAAFGLTPDIPVYVDVATVPERSGNTVSYVDLDLDVIQLRDGTVYLDDEDEFTEHQIKYGYPPDVVKAAESTAQDLLEAVRTGDGPFGGAHERWLAQVS